jgi:hypothetical protein
MREEGSGGRRGISEKRVWWRWWQVGVVARGVALRIAAALFDKSVGNNNSISSKSSIGSLRVQTGVDERHLHEDKSERVRG